MTFKDVWKGFQGAPPASGREWGGGGGGGEEGRRRGAGEEIRGRTACHNI